MPSRTWGQMRCADLCSEISSRFSPETAIRAQRRLARMAVVSDQYSTIRVVVGLDASYRRGLGETGLGVAVALRYPSMRVLACSAVARRICIPYVPGLLAFREMAVMVPALLGLGVKPDLIVVDGHGIAHPRRAGIATHVGVVFDVPSIGVAKRRLYGEERTISGTKYLVDKDGTLLAGILDRGRSRIYVSPGHRLSVETSMQLVKKMIRRGRLPEPTRIADHISKTIKNNIPSDIGCDVVRIPCSGNSSRNTLS